MVNSFIAKNMIKYILLFSFYLLINFAASSQEKSKKIILAIFSHPDDEAVTNVSAILSKYATEGHLVYLVIATKGELGVNKHANIPAGDSLATTRAAEAVCACKQLGIQPPVLLGLGDGSLAKDFTGRPLRQKLDSVFKIYQPDVVITWGPDGGYGHMDHRTVHNVVTELLQSDLYQKQTQLYYTGIPTENFNSMPDLKSGVKGMYQAWKSVKKDYLTTRIKFSKQDLEKAVAAMRCHQSQFTPEQMEDNRLWMMHMNKDTAYLRPFKPTKKITYSLF